jgi:hypothetical protein
MLRSRRRRRALHAVLTPSWLDLAAATRYRQAGGGDFKAVSVKSRVDALSPIHATAEPIYGDAESTGAR